MNSTKGKFIVFEGIDGSGKSTQIELLSQKLSENGIKCFETREPTDFPTGTLIHDILTGNEKADGRAVACLFAADRIEHVVNKKDGLLTKLNDGITIICDRYYFSSYAYHGVDADMDWVIDINSVSRGLLKPDATIFMDISAKTAMQRIMCGRDHTELYEKEDRLALVRSKYFEAFGKLKNEEKIFVIDADKGVEAIADEVWNIVSAL